MKKLVLALALVLGFSGVAKAGIMIEPYMGYENGKTTDINGIDGKYDGTSIGARLAYKLPLLLWFGVDGSVGISGSYKPDTGANSDLKHTTIYGVVGVDLPILLRGWVGYGFSDESTTGTPYNGKIKGKNFKLGVGFTMLPLVSLNVEYLKGTSDELTSSGTTSTISGKSESLMFSVSLPVTF